MALVLGEIDTKKRLLSKLRTLGLDFNSLEDVTSFKADWEKRIETIGGVVRKKIIQEITELEQHLKALEEEYRNKIIERTELLKKEKEEIDSKIANYLNSQHNVFKKYTLLVK